MKKRKLLILIILLLFIFPKVVVAAEVKCSTVKDTVEDYKDVVDKIEELECETTEDEDLLKECRKKNTEKADLLSKLFKYNDTTNCNNASLKKIIEENKNECSNIFGSSLKDFTNYAMGIFYLIAPFLLIIFGSLDFSKIVVMNDPKEAIELRRKFFKRLIAFVLLLILPWLVNFILNFNFSKYNLDSDIYVCKGNINFKIKRWETIYVPKTNKKNSKNTYTGDWHIDWFQMDERWADLPFDSGGDGTPTLGHQGCGSLATSIVAAHYGKDDSESSPYYPANVAKEYYSKKEQPNLRADSIVHFFNEWHTELGVTASFTWGEFTDMNRLDAVLANGGCAIVCYTSAVKYGDTSIWTSGGHYVTIFGGNQQTGYRVADSNGNHSTGGSGVKDWAPYGEHYFEKQYIQPAKYYILI